MILAVPSKGRVGRVTTLKRIPSAVLFVPEVEAAAYRKAYPKDHVEAVPQTVLGITKTRNWIMGTVDDPDLIFVDDDVKKAGWVRMDRHSCKHVKMSESEIIEESSKLFDLTRSIGYRIWGPATLSAPRAVYPYRPFIWQSYVTASFMGICNETGIRFDESFPVKEDYEICLRCIRDDGGVVAARHWYWENSHWSDPGGCKDYRTQTMERDCIRRLMRMYPGMIRRVTRGGSEFSIELAF